MKKSKTLWIILFLINLTDSSFSGQLGDFEKAIDKPHSNSSSKSKSSSFDDDGFFESIFSDIVGGIFKGLLYGTYRCGRYVVYDWWAEESDDDSRVYEESIPIPAYPNSSNIIYSAGNSSEVLSKSYSPKVISDPFDSNTLQESGHYQDEEPSSGAGNHRRGTASLPFVRFDYRWQYLDSDTYAHDYLLEAGYKYIAFYSRMSRYTDRDADEKLSINQYYGLVRGSTETGSFCLGIGLGVYVIDGEHRNSGAALTIPVILYPTNYIGIEFRPAWASVNNHTISDYDISVSGGYRYVHLRAGYRWLWIQGNGHWLNGSYAGFSVLF